MITEYIAAAMKQAHYEILEDKSYYGEIQGLKGVWSNSDTLEGCREQLQEVLEGWIILRLSKGMEIHEISGFSLYAKELV